MTVIQDAPRSDSRPAPSIERRRNDALLTGQRDVFELLAMGGSLTDVLTALVRLVEAQSAGLLGSVLVRQRDEDRFCLGVAPAIAPRYAAALSGASILPPYTGPCGQAAHLGEVVAVADIAGDERWSPEWRALALECGLRTCYSIPISASDGAVLGSFAFYYGEPRDPEPADSRLLATAAHIASVAIERSHAAAALRLSEEQLRAAVTAARLGTWELEAPTMTLTCSPQARANLGRPDAVAFTFDDFRASVHPDDRERVIAAVRGAIEQRSEYAAEYRCLWPDGSVRWMESRGHAVAGPGGDTARLVGVTLDVTRRKGDEEALQSSNAQLEAELADTRLLRGISAQFADEANVAALYERILDVVAEIMGSEFASIQMLYPDRVPGGELRLLGFRGFNPAAAKFWEWVRLDSESSCGVALRTGARVVVPDVDRCDFMAGSDDLAAYRDTGIRAVQSTPLRSSRGRIVGMISTHWDEPHEPSERELQLLDIVARQAADLMERMLADEALRQRTAQFETLLAAAPLGVYLVDDGFRIREANPTALAAFAGIPDPVGQDFDTVIHRLWSAPNADEVVGRFRHTLATGEPYATPERIEQRLDGGTEYFEWQINRIPLPDGGHGVVCYFRDISAQVQARAAFAESQDRLRQAAKMEAVGRLAGGLAHDFNNELQAVRGFAEYAARDPGMSSQSRRDLKEVERAADRMADLTRQLLAFSRQQVLRLESLDLDQAVADGQELLRRLIGSHIEFVVTRGAGAKWVRADRTQLQQVLMNLCLNARDAMPDGGRLEVRTGVWTADAGGTVPNGAPVAPGRYVELSVSDTGAGIDAEHLPHIFEPFFTTKEVGQGTGLGLATVHGIVAQSDGHVFAETAAGRGSRFTVLLPLAREPAGGGPTAWAATVEPERRARILVVEDEGMVRAFMARTLAGAGYDVLEAGHGADALALLAQHGDVGLVLSDVVMPVMGGKALAERVAAEHPDLPLVWMSGYPRDSAFADGRMAGDRPFLQKPIPPALLLETVARALAHR